MPDETPRDPDHYPFQWKGIAIALVKAAGLHEGVWRVRVEYAPIMALNVNLGEFGILPASMAGIKGIALVEDDAVGPLSVDAAIVNPAARILMPSGGFN